MELTTFCADPRLVKLLELAKSSNDFLELLSPGENQHSDILSWCFNAREGHSQGDAILKDFLVAIFLAATASDPGDKVFGHGLSRDFVRAWTPARIMSSSFATAICYREYTLPKGKRDADYRRLDLLVVDLDNKLLIVIENKSGARVRPGQLEGYVGGVQTTLLSRSVFKDFHVVFVAMDRNYEFDGESDADDTFDGRWVRLSYEWLRPAGMRAELAVERGNRSAALLLSYCRAQTGWESKEIGFMTSLARDIAIRFPTVIAEIKRVSTDLSKPESWTRQLLAPDSIEGQLLRLYLQNTNAFNWLVDLSPLQLLHAKLIEHLPNLDEHYQYGRVWMVYQLPLDLPLPRVDARFPLFLRVRHTNPDGAGQPKFRVELVWRPHCVPVDDQEHIRAILSKQFSDRDLKAGRKIALKLYREDHNNFDTAEVAIKAAITRVQIAFQHVP